jgi:MFS family permease
MEGANIASPLVTASIQYVINMVFTLPAIIYIDKWGRRASLLIGAFVLMICLFVSGALQGVYGQPNTDATRTNENNDITWLVLNNKPVSAAIVTCSYIFVATYAMTWGPASWTYPAEIFPSKIRAKAVAICTAANWFWNCALAFAVPPLLWNINWKMYMIFAVFNGIAFVHMFLTMPETKGKLLEEMDEVFDSGRKPWQGVRKGSRLDDLAREIEAGMVDVKLGPIGTGKRDSAMGGRSSSTVSLQTTHQHDNARR